MGDVEAETLYSWLLEFRTNEYDAMYKVFRKPLDNSLNGPELWDRYFNLGKHYLIEMRMLREKAKLARTKWKECPIFGGDVNAEEPDATEVDYENPYKEDSETIGV